MVDRVAVIARSGGGHAAEERDVGAVLGRSGERQSLERSCPACHVLAEDELGVGEDRVVDSIEGIKADRPLDELQGRASGSPPRYSRWARTQPNTSGLPGAP